jgi:hypothetical protein
MAYCLWRVVLLDVDLPRIAQDRPLAGTRFRRR